MLTIQFYKKKATDLIQLDIDGNSINESRDTAEVLKKNFESVRNSFWYGTLFFSLNPCMGVLP